MVRPGLATTEVGDWVGEDAACRAQTCELGADVLVEVSLCQTGGPVELGVRVPLEHLVTDETTCSMWLGCDVLRLAVVYGQFLTV